MPAKIQAEEPHADFMTPDVYACAPSLVNFTDLSVDGDSYLWDFGDSTTSTNKTPSHIYNTPGIYTVSLIVQSNSGCSDTLVRPQYIQVLRPHYYISRPPHLKDVHHLMFLSLINHRMPLNGVGASETVMQT